MQDPSLNLPQGGEIDYRNRILCFDSTYTAVHLTTHRDIYYLHVEYSFGPFIHSWVFWICWDTGVLSASVSDFVI
jgi:hypothetical protein